MFDAYMSLAVRHLSGFDHQPRSGEDGEHLWWWRCLTDE